MANNIFLENEEQTQKLGALLFEKCESPIFIALHGDLGAGKTTFARGFIIKSNENISDVPSPTFTLLQTYSENIHHLDLYRLKSPEEIWELGWEELISDFVICEWPEMAGEYLPHKRLEIYLKITPKGRTAEILPIGDSDFITLWQRHIGQLKNEFI